MLSYLLLILLLLSSAAYYLGRNRAFRVAGDHIRNHHSCPVSMVPTPPCGAVSPALIVVTVWAVLQPGIILELVVAGLPPELRELPPDRLGLVLNDIKESGQWQHRVRHARPHHPGRRRALPKPATDWPCLLVDRRLAPGHRWHRSQLARNLAKAACPQPGRTVVTLLLIVSSTVAIFTTIGIVLSVLFESIRFSTRCR